MIPHCSEAEGGGGSYYSGELEPHKMELCTRSMKGAEQIDSLIVLVSTQQRFSSAGTPV